MSHDTTENTVANAPRRSVLKAGLGSLVAGPIAATPNGAHAASPLPFDGKVALVTGAARGIGRATAEAFARRGAAVALLDIADPAAFRARPGYRVADRVEFDAAVAAVAAHGGRVLALQADVRDRKAMVAAVDRAAATLGGLDFVIANAGFVAWHLNADGAEDDFTDVVDVNIHGVWKTVQPALPHLRARGGGRIVTIASVGGRAGFVGNGIYTATKWALIGLTKQMALEFGPANITVNAVSPGPVNTVMYRSQAQIASMGLKTAAEQDAAMRAFLPLAGRTALEPAEIADAILFLCSNAAAAISGVALDVALGYNASYTA